MSSLFSLIIFVYVMIAIVKTMKIKREETQKQSGNTINKPVFQSKPMTPPVNHRNDNSSKPPTGTSVYQREVKQTVSQSPEQSTMDYLAEKAKKEQESQDKAAKMNTPTRVNGRRVAIRLYEGDLPPAGMRVVKCHYCGAENLVPHNSTEKFVCYFCREDI